MSNPELESCHQLTCISSNNIKVLESEISVVFCVRNEKFRLPYFLEYYRNLGVTHFFAVDNASKDDTQQYLLSQSDVHLFYTESSYKESNAGRDWTTYLAKKYCNSRWVLTLDVDEYLVYPLIEQVDLHGFCAYLEKWGYQGVMSIFLDFYSKGPLSEASYKEGSSPFDVCNYFDTADSYSVFETSNFPYLQIKGGIRQRKFWDKDDPRSGPSMRKLVLVRWDDEFEYLHSTHSCTPIRLADITSVIAHFKFLSHFKDYSKSEVQRNDRVANSGDWKVYANALEKEDVIFHEPDYSIKYKNSRTLIEDGHISCSLRYFDHATNSRRSVALVKDTQVDSILSREEVVSTTQSHAISYSNLNKVWSGIGLFNQTFGSDLVGNQDLFRIEEDVESIINSRYWRATFYLRKFCARIGLCDQRSIPEEMKNQTLHSKFIYTYRSIWWDITSPLRIIARVVSKIFRRK